jgi:hypothetical protein
MVTIYLVLVSDIICILECGALYHLCSKFKLVLAFYNFKVPKYSFRKMNFIYSPDKMQTMQEGIHKDKPSVKQ